MSSSAPTHQTQTVTDRFKSREEQAARAAGQLPPEIDVQTGSMINPHNPEFITKRPWYLGGSGGGGADDPNAGSGGAQNDGPSLSHQGNQKTDIENWNLEFTKCRCHRCI